MAGRWVAIMATVLLTTACAPPAAPPPIPPAEAQPLTQPGSHDQRLDDVVKEVRDALEPRYGKLEVQAYSLPAGAAWPGILAHFEAQRPNWKVEPRLPSRIRAAQAKAWKRDRDVLAVALIDTPVAGERLDYTILVLAEPR